MAGTMGLPLYHTAKGMGPALVDGRPRLLALHQTLQHDCSENGIQSSKQKWRPGLVASCVLVPDQSTAGTWSFSSCHLGVGHSYRDWGCPHSQAHPGD